MEEAQEIVSAVVHDRFPSATIERITVEPDVDQDGDPILKITVIFEGKLDAHRMVGLVRHVQPKLMEHHFNQFPIFRFVSKKDAASLKIAAA